LALLIERRNEQLTHQELLMGVAIATLANHSFAMPKEPYSPADFMPSQLAEKERAKKRAQKRNPQDVVAESLHSIFGGMIEDQQMVGKVVQMPFGEK
jgi:hypothetical protein